MTAFIVSAAVDVRGRTGERTLCRIIMSDDAVQLAQQLLATSRTVVLSTARAPALPWTAPVYFLWRDGRCWFFSSPTSRHIEESLAAGQCAAAVFRDGADWRDIEGLQMEGAIESVSLDADEADAVFNAYLSHFPTAAEFFEDGPPDLAAFATKFRSALYAFTPTRALYLNNRAGFGTRVEVQLSA